MTVTRREKREASLVAHPAYGLLFAALTVISWASFNLAAKSGIDAGLSSSSLAFLRYAVPGLLALPLAVFLFRRAPLTREAFSRLLALSLLSGPVFGGLALGGYSFSPLSHGLLFAPVAVFVTASALSWAFLSERISASRLAGAVVMFLGLAVLVGLQLENLPQTWPLGALLFVSAGALFGSYTVLLRAWQVPVVQGSILIAAISALSTIPLLLPWVADDLARMPWRTLGFQAFMQGGVGGILSVMCLMAALRSVSTQVAAMLPTFTPVVALFLDRLVLGAVPTKAEIVGTVLVMVGFGIAIGLADQIGIRRTPKNDC